MSKYPTIRTIIDNIKPLFPQGFILRVTYSGSDDSGWFDGWDIVFANGEYLSYQTPERDKVVEIVEASIGAINEELYTMLGSRFPGWEIGDGHVQGAHGHFDIDAVTNRITQSHIVNYNEHSDQSPDEEEKF